MYVREGDIPSLYSIQGKPGRDRAVGISILGAGGEETGEWEVGLEVFNVRYGVHRSIVIEKVMSRGLAPVQVAVSVYNALSRVGRT
jgi:hypothetical protein